jgi:cell division protein FtsB
MLESFEAGLTPLLQAAAAIEAHLSAQVPPVSSFADSANASADAATAAEVALSLGAPFAAALQQQQQQRAIAVTPPTPELGSPSSGLPADVEALQQHLAVTKARLADERARAADLQDNLAAKEVRDMLGRVCLEW